MTSEQHLAPFRMPDRLFAELAAGGGSAAAVAFLERAERARRLLLLRTVLGHLDALPTPLTPVAEAWRVLKEAAEKSPEPVERLLLAPATGGWISHMLRRVHGTATGPPLWAEAGHLCALALSAALHAGTEAALDVPLTQGGLPLPGLGMVQLPDARAGLAIGRATAAGGELTVTGPGRTTDSVRVTCRPLTRSADADGGIWLPLRTLTHTGPDGTAPVTVVLEDLDPYRDLDDHLPPARLDEDEAQEWQRLFGEAARILARPGVPGPGRVDPAMIRAIVPFGRTAVHPPPLPFVQVSASSGDSFGGMLIVRPASALALAETLVHELQHSKLAALLHLFPLLEDDRAERYYAPWRTDPRHLTGLLHGAYAFTGVAGFWRDRLAGAEGIEAVDRAAYFFALRRLQSRLAVRTLLTSGRLTVQGRALVSGLARTLDGWLREPVPYTALTRARTAAALHRTEWRLRNVDPGVESPPDGPRFRLDRASWPDVRTHAFAARPVAPHTADEHLAAGDAATALARYAELLAADPAEPHALAGWIVARAVLDPGRATRRMLARPELLQPLPSG
ncbi:HEXXH motif domain-containing protein [Streptomyces lomondensis]|uniref:HEXXH motif domain-containing protein n=1 Tax=Streptomyces lomondensis TaxID=68229 RepID=A0ABQ2XAE8_9ACTN|nr:HEXXH motif domain-containing protein [Streptomyces lomondensis]MCF0077035.1 HEXXH motif domain-containing protein [Streptomyces lomondensis]GGX07207.1 HEXXH motif domain-containing protein [Streptomyces lomondensis]